MCSSVLAFQIQLRGFTCFTGNNPKYRRAASVAAPDARFEGWKEKSAMTSPDPGVYWYTETPVCVPVLLAISSMIPLSFKQSESFYNVPFGSN